MCVFEKATRKAVNRFLKDNLTSFLLRSGNTYNNLIKGELNENKWSKPIEVIYETYQKCKPLHRELIRKHYFEHKPMKQVYEELGLKHTRGALCNRDALNEFANLFLEVQVSHGEKEPLDLRREPKINASSYYLNFEFDRDLTNLIDEATEKLAQPYRGLVKAYYYNRKNVSEMSELFGYSHDEIIEKMKQGITIWVTSICNLIDERLDLFNCRDGRPVKKAR